MKEKTQSTGPNPLHQSVAQKLKFKVGTKSIAVDFTDQRISAHAGTATFWGWLHLSGFLEVLEKALPHQMPLSNNHLTPLEKAVGFLQGILCEARKLTHVAYLRRDPLMPQLLGVRRIPSQSTLSRFFNSFGGLAANATCFRALWNSTMKRLPSRREGYTLDLDSTKLLHEDGNQEGVKSGFTRQGIKPCLHPLLGILAEVRMVASFWLRAGNASCANNVISFVHDLIANLPIHIRLRGVRADSGFCVPELLEFFESRRLPYVVVARLQEKIQTLLRSDLKWKPTEVSGMEVAESVYQAAGWKRARRLILIRHRKDQKGRRTGGKELFDLPEYLFQALVTSWPLEKDALWVWLLQQTRRLRECDQGTPARLWNLRTDLRTLPRHRGRLVLGCGCLQPHRTLPARVGLADQSHDSVPAVLDLCHGRTHLQPPRPDNDQVRRS